MAWRASLFRRPFFIACAKACPACPCVCLQCPGFDHTTDRVCRKPVHIRHGASVGTQNAPVRGSYGSQTAPRAGRATPWEISPHRARTEHAAPWELSIEGPRGVGPIGPVGWATARREVARIAFRRASAPAPLPMGQTWPLGGACGAIRRCSVAFRTPIQWYWTVMRKTRPYSSQRGASLRSVLMWDA